MAIRAYGIPLVSVNFFKYLGRVLLAAYDNWTEVINKLWRARWKWARLTRVLIREGVNARTMGQIYLAVVQSFMLYRLETWFITPHIGRFLGRFHHRVDRRLTGRQP